MFKHIFGSGQQQLGQKPRCLWYTNLMIFLEFLYDIFCMQWRNHMLLNGCIYVSGLETIANSRVQRELSVAGVRKS